ncbi:MAG: Rpn family recombination-promoting nuclease/putative transposase [Lachnospiraceae bacterium]|nr:Rpn family recombination-promoting nuclease/putative transposase [Lachnospiraceae bacterium]
MSNRKKKPFDQLTITDNYMFQAVMKEPKHVKPLLEMIIGKKIRKVVVVDREKTLETGYDARGIRMDVYVEDDENTVYDVEMQASRKAQLGKRFRYYQSAIDVDMVNKGESFVKLKKSFIIFITTYDPYDKGWFMYPFETLCSWDETIRMHDSAKRIVLNTKGTKDKEGHEVSDEIKKMLAYMDGKAPETEYSRMLDEAVKKIKHNEARRTEYMNINTFAIDEREMGEYMKIVSLIRINDKRFSDSDIVSILNIKPVVLYCVRKALSEHPDWDDEDIAEEVLAMDELDEADD